MLRSGLFSTGQAVSSWSQTEHGLGTPMQSPGLGVCLDNKETSSYSKQDEAACVGHELFQHCLCVGRLFAGGQ